MPFLFLMPMIVFCGMWEVAARSTQELMQASKPRE
jgi:hypothetical protein